MHRFWEKVIKPLIGIKAPKHIVEIGSQGGKNTFEIIDYCRKNNCFLSSIDPFPQFDYKKLEDENKNLFKMYLDLSLNALEELKNIDIVLIDGDHNWYTVYNELQLIYKNTNEEFPLIIFHDIGWPYGRRDLYYNPENIPSHYQNPHQKSGISPNQKKLVGENGLNNHLFNSIYENNNKNGVLTAIEDFIKDTGLALEFYTFQGLNGLGICFLPDSKFADKFNEQEILKQTLLLTENDRILKEIELNNLNKNIKNITKSKDEILTQKNQELKSKDEILTQKNQEIDNLRLELTTIYTGKSWKLTRPFRKFKKIMRK